MGDQDPNTPDPSVELKAKLDEMKTQLEAKEKEAKSNQRRADRLQAKVDRTSLLQAPAVPISRSRPPGRVQPPPAGGETVTTQELVAEFATDSAKEAMLLREVLTRGLTLEDVEGLEFESPAELQAQLNDIQQKQEITRLRVQVEQLAADRKSGAPTGDEGSPGADDDVSPVVIDTGGASSGEAADQLQQANDLRQKATELKAQKRYTEAARLASMAAQLDPTKRMLVRKQ